MSAAALLAVLVALLLAVVSLAVAGGLGYAVYRRPSLAQPVAIAVTATGVLAAVVFGIIQTVRP
ncbi:hypothetical protein ACFW6K_22185 [Streptomyces sp. NPDC058733]|uniref:hypothetical protein n=1 Tax=unclassified Streptomyces TaxID=2593676 RepID=UPI0034545B72